MMTEIRLQIRPRLLLRKLKEIVVDYAVADFDHDLSIDFSDYGTEANATAKLSLQNLEKAPVKYFDQKSSIKVLSPHECVVIFVVLNLYPYSIENTILFNRQNFHKLILYLLTKEF